MTMMNVSFVYKCPVEYQCRDGRTATLLLPFVNESDWSIGARALLYLVALLWCFMGVAIAADLFMCAIEVITSQTKVIKVATDSDDPKGQTCEEVEVRVWNDTVANLTLMALGSSAPEILLAIIEIAGNRFESGELGPGTIVGSAAFNLLCITGVCVIAVPSGQSKIINTFSVFLTTAFFAIFAYVWIFIVIEVASPQEISVAEALITLLLFPILVLLAYIADRNFCGLGERRKKPDDVELSNADVVNEDFLKKYRPDLVEYIKEITSNPRISEEEAAMLISKRLEAGKTKNYSYYRVDALRRLCGGRKLEPKLNPKLLAMVDGASGPSLNAFDFEETPRRSVVEFSASAVSVVESAKFVQLGVTRSNRTSTSVTVNYETIDGTAKAGSDYISTKDILIFEPNETYKYIDIIVIDDDEWEPDETFFVKLSVEPSNDLVELGEHSIVEVTIINDDDPGVFQFTKPSHVVKESCGKAHIAIQRLHGADGRVNVPYQTRNQSAVSGKDYIGVEGAVAFDHGETLKTIDIDIIDDHTFEKDETFMIEIGNISVPGAKLGRLKRTVVTIVNDDDYRKMFDRVVSLAHLNVHKLRLSTETWGEQFVTAMNVNGGNIKDATIMDYVMHVLTFAWKVLFAFVPPCSWFHGWLAFFILILLIGVLTTIIGDLATVFGCLVGLKAEITAITFVAMGTSLPDLFASRNAAINEKFADAAIGNVTGSNGVNVFLGLGIPWTMAAIYHQAKGSTFRAAAGTLATSVVTYTVMAIVCVGMLVARRYLGIFGKGELGGPSGTKYATGLFMFFMWFIYVIISALVSYGHVSPIKL